MLREDFVSDLPSMMSQMFLRMPVSRIQCVDGPLLLPEVRKKDHDIRQIRDFIFTAGTLVVVYS